MPTKIEDAYVIGSENFNNWSVDYDPVGYLKVLPHPDLKVPFQDPFKDWQAGRPGNYVSSWGPNKELNVTLRMDDLGQVKIDGLGILKSGDGVIPWLNNKPTPYEKLRSYNGTIPGPMLITEPGDTLKINLLNDLSEPAQASNLHTHGLHVSALGYGDNVLNSIEPGQSWPASIKLPDDAYIGIDWYHPHLHGLTNEQVASGLAGQLVLLAPHDIPDLNKFNPKTEPFHFMALNTFGIQQIDRIGKPNDPLNQNPNTPVPAGTPLKVEGVQGGDLVYSLSDAPFVGYNAKPLGYDPKQPTGNPAEFVFGYGSGGLAEPVENVIYTVNGQYNPTIDANTGQWNLFSFTNMSTNTFHVINLVKKVGDQLIPQKVQVVGLDGDASGVAAINNPELATLPTLSPGQRISWQEWFQDPGTYYLLSNGTDEILGDNTPDRLKGQKGFADGHLIWGPQVLATINVTGNSIPTGPVPQAYDFLTRQAQKTDQLITDAQNGKVDRERTFIWSANLGGALLLGNSPEDTDAASFEGTYGINGKFFAQNFTDSMVPLALPMLGSTEVWDVVNTSGSLDPNLPAQINIPLLEWHPFHIHQNDFTVLSINGIAAKDMKNTYINGALQDTIALPPTYNPSIPPSADNPYGVPMIGGTPSNTEILMKFEDFPGNFVNHCHILFHEDAGMMAPVRVILNTRDTWLSSSSQLDPSGQVELRRANDSQQPVRLMAYGQSHKGAVQTAIGDINYKQKPSENQHVTDNVTDVAVVQSAPDNGELKVKVFDGKALIQKQESGQQVINGEDSSLILTQFTPFLDTPLTANTKTAIATGDINGDGYSDILIGISGDRNPVVEIYSGKDYHLMSRLNPLAVHDAFTGVITIASGDLNGDNFDDILIGGGGSVAIYNGLIIESQGSLDGRVTAARSEFMEKHLHPYGTAYTGGIDVASGYILQRPDTPNGAATQTYHANITTLATETVPQGQQSIKVFTLTGGHGHTGHTEGTGHTGHTAQASQTGQTEQTGHTGHTGHTAQDTVKATTDSSGLQFPSNLRLDAEFTPLGKITNLYGTFADLPGLPRGEPVLYAQNSANGTELIHLGAMNNPSLMPLPAKVF